jgi:hypothetical protein
MHIRLKIIQRPTVEYIDGIRVDCYAVGNVYVVSRTIAEVFFAEGWAEPAPPRGGSTVFPPPPIPIYSKS